MWNPAFTVMKLSDSQFGCKYSIANLTLSELPQMQFVTQGIKRFHSRFYHQFLLKTLPFLATSSQEAK